MVKQKIIPLLMLPIILFTMFGEYITTAYANFYSDNELHPKETLLEFTDECAKSYLNSENLSYGSDFVIFGTQREVGSTYVVVEIYSNYFTTDAEFTVSEYDDYDIYTLTKGSYYTITSICSIQTASASTSSYSMYDTHTFNQNAKIYISKDGELLRFIGNNNNYWYNEDYITADTYYYEDFFSIGNISNNKKLDLSVSFTPSLEGTVDRLIDQNGVQAESNYFSMTLTNNAPGNAQYMFAIVPSGSAVDFNTSASNYNMGVDVNTADGIFYFTLKEWIYAPTMAYGNLGTSRIVTEYSQNTFWHVISGSSSITHNFNWAQINIAKDTAYDAVVIALPTDYTKPSRVFSNSSADYYLDLSTAQEVYRSTFTVPNPVTYDSNNTEFGNVTNNGIISSKNNSLQADGYIDENGNPVIEDLDYGDTLEDVKNFEAPVISNALSDLSLSDVSSLLQQTESFFDFLGVCFSWLPGWFWAILLFGVTALVIIGVVKAIL